jgi:hypothetical protein
MALVERHSVIDEVLEAWASALGGDERAYGGHVYRVYNFARRLYGSSDRDDDLAVASVFHDLGIWSDQTFDYLQPSAARAVAHLMERGQSASARLMEQVIENHHRLARVRGGDGGALIDAFRRADLVDVTAGWLRAGLDRGFLREAEARFPYDGFHGFLLRTAGSWLVRHPFNPLPMVRLGKWQV